MAASNLPGLRLEQRRGLVMVLAVLAAAVLYFLKDSAFPYFASFDAKSYGDLWPRRWGLLVHIAGGGAAACTGLVQLWLGLTGRTAETHRGLGRAYGTAIVVGSIGAYYLALTLDPKDIVYASGLFMLSSAWVVTTSMAIVAVKRRALEQHREWMIRSYTVTFAFVTFRLVARWLTDAHVAAAADVQAIMAWACWAVPLLCCEPLLQLRKMKRR
jgi:hypothetical protein